MNNNTRLPRHIIFFDGTCNLCNGAVKHIIKYDHHHVFKFASLQSDFAQAHLRAYPTLPDSIVLWHEGDISTKSTAALRIAKILGGAHSLLVIGFLLPQFMRDWMYDYIAKNRYRWFGQKDQCVVPNKELQARFLD